MSTDKIALLLNWHATPYHLPIFLAQSKGAFVFSNLLLTKHNPPDENIYTAKRVCDF